MPLVTFRICVHPHGSKKTMRDNLAVFFKALSDPTRLRILRVLMEAPHCVCELESELGLAQPLLSRHLAYMRHAGIVEGVREGVRVNYRLRRDNETLRRLLPELRAVMSAEERTGTAP